MKITLYREDFKILSDATDCFDDMLVGEFNIKREDAEHINEIEIDAEIIGTDVKEVA